MLILSRKVDQAVIIYDKDDTSKIIARLVIKTAQSRTGTVTVEIEIPKSKSKEA